MPQSKFYQRYLASQASKHEHNDDMDETTVVDVTAGGTSSKNGDKKERRGQIFNKTEVPKGGEVMFIEKSDAAKAFLISTLRDHYLFGEVSAKDMEKIIGCMQYITILKDNFIIRQNEDGDLFYCLESGSAAAIVDGIGNVANYQRGGCFGELALIYNCPRAASVVATEICTLWTLDIHSFRTILVGTSQDETSTRTEFLKKCLFLNPLSSEQIGKVAIALQPVSFDDGTTIVKQGDEGDTFYIIESGAVRCTQSKADGREVELVTLRAGDYFGEMALMLNETRLATCTAVGNTNTLTLHRDHFHMLLGSVQDVLASKMRMRILQSVPILSKVSEKKLVRLASVMRVQTFSAGDYIIRQGEEGSRFYIISEGDVMCTRTINSSQEEELIKLGAHEFFGEKALITNETRKANVVAITDVECLVLDRTNFQAMLAEVEEKMTDELSRRRKDEDSANDRERVQFKAETNYNYSDLKMMRMIGEGTFGQVKVVQHKQSGRVYALKCMTKQYIEDNRQVSNVMTERDTLYLCRDCNFIVNLYQTFNLPNEISMLLDFVQGGELWTYIYEKTDSYARNKVGGIASQAVQFLSANVVLALEFMHNLGIAYRDLKPENIIVDGKGYLKIVDFGFAKFIPYTQNNKKFAKTFTLCGTPEYLAPEIVMSKGYDKSVDLWALGCLMFELYAQRTPFAADNNGKIFKNILSSKSTLKFPARMDPHQVSLIRKLLQQNPAFRIGNLSGGVQDIMDEPFFSTIDFEALKRRDTIAPFVPMVVDELDSSNFEIFDTEITEVPNYHGNQSAFKDF